MYSAWPSSCGITIRRTSRAYTVVLRKMPSATLVPVSRKNVRMTRGENCWLASCRATIVIDTTRVVMVSVDAAIVASSVWALDASPLEGAGDGDDVLVDLGDRPADDAHGEDHHRRDEPQPVADGFAQGEAADVVVRREVVPVRSGHPGILLPGSGPVVSLR